MRFFVLSVFAIGVVLGLGAAEVVLKGHMDNRTEQAALEDHGQRANTSVVSREHIRGRTM